MAPEFLNRIDEIVMFTPLSVYEIKQIVELQVKSLKKKLLTQEINIHVSEKGIIWLTRNSYNPQFGARPVKRAIQRSILNELSKKILNDEVNKEQIILIDVKDVILSFSNITPDELTKFIEREKKENEDRLKELKNTPVIQEESKELNEVKKKGIFGRFFSWIGNLFRHKQLPAQAVNSKV
jgi:hypothetical protein